jgi:hypothetical protein
MLLDGVAVGPIRESWDEAAQDAVLARIIQRGAIRPHGDTGGGVVFCGVEDAGVGV